MIKDENCNFNECGFNYTLSLIEGKYKMSILYCLFRNQVIRYNELKRILKPISFKTLTNTLRSLENDKLIIRKEYPQIPPKVEYSLSKRGQSLIPILEAMCEWGENHKKG
ncbi:MULTISPECIES: MarR family transcription factor RrpA [Campylobacter]|uniref:Transcriptional regulator n=1 Tax=Campylobacter taeniopygiae TaxID=2510188 RepID=A0ABY2TLH5_9BACT|nr:helix-turn-helix domain-containing protein [Campylobacter taeniopygiae]MBZ7935371.1 helix-turn-helix transcriptional regulator [Campylobacter sp. B0100352/1]MBZ7963775.1 helix-turn-helix transcriptional regulator [Campylobacter sp. 2457A]TKX34737.1 transcriptional regulator [Campylobacter taeniopygiae]